MYSQKQVVLSLGSNLGNRLENIKLAIQSIHAEIGTVVKISPIYETPAWGFESNLFLNGVILIHTLKPAAEILTLISEIEKQ